MDIWLWVAAYLAVGIVFTRLYYRWFPDDEADNFFWRGLFVVIWPIPLVSTIIKTLWVVLAILAGTKLRR